MQKTYQTSNALEDKFLVGQYLHKLERNGWSGEKEKDDKQEGIEQQLLQPDVLHIERNVSPVDVRRVRCIAHKAVSKIEFIIAIGTKATYLAHVDKVVLLLFQLSINTKGKQE